MLDAGAAPLAEFLGFDGIEGVRVTEQFLTGTLVASGGRVALVVVAWGARLDPMWRPAVIEATRNGCRWAILFNGTHLRLVDARRVFMRRYAEFDLDAAADEADAWPALWAIFGAPGFAACDRGASSLDQLVVASEQHSSRVCRSLRTGVLSASAAVLEAVAGRDLSAPALDAAFEQSLTIVYRLLFLLFAEARQLLPVWHPIYSRSYSVDALRAAAELPANPVGMWDALQAMARLAHAGCVAGDLRVTPFNGRLFAPSRTPLAERRNLDDAAARDAVAALSTTASDDGAGRERIEYRELGVEQLGAVYETLLDYEPRAVRSGRRQHVTLERGSTARKRSATFYTPQPLAQYLVRAALEPLTAAAAPEQILSLRIVDPAAGSGAFLVAACRFLAGAYEDALIATGACHPADLGPQERASIRRQVAERCLFGVDLNPMAVQLARLSLWLATLSADRPLTFLDHHLLVGDSLIGASVSRLRSAAPAHRRRKDQSTLPLFDDSFVENAVATTLPVRLSLEAPDDTVDRVRAKERALAGLVRDDLPLSRLKRAADAWCAAWFAGDGVTVPSRAVPDIADAILSGRSSLPAQTVAMYRAAADAAAQSRRFFHWELEFPEVFFTAEGTRRPDGGFDAVISNPPWDMLRADLGGADDRAGHRGSVKSLTRFARDSGLYVAGPEGHANLYQLFTERALGLTRPGGRIALLLPAGLLSDHGSAALRRHLLSRSDVDAIVGIDNRNRVFPIHRSTRFVLVSATAGRSTREIRCTLGVHDLDVLGDRPATETRGGVVSVTVPLLEHVSGRGLAIPWILDSADLAILERAHAAFEPLGAASGWGASFGRELNATDDRGLFRPRDDKAIPVVEGKHLRPFQVDLSQARHYVRLSDVRGRFGTAGAPHRPRLAYRDVASPTNRLTLIACVLPADCVSTHTVFCLRTRLPLIAQHFLCGLFNSLVVNFFVRLRVSTHVTTEIVERLPVPSIEHAPATARKIAALARLLSRKTGPAEFARLNALVAQLYGLTAAEYDHVVGSFPLLPEHERDRCVAEYASGLRLLP